MASEHNEALLKKNYYENCPGCKVDRLKESQRGVPIKQLLLIWIIVLCVVLPIYSLFPFFYFLGLVVPVIRGADKMKFADIEKEINTLAKKANDGSISIDEMAGGSFTISNGGVYLYMNGGPLAHDACIFHKTVV